MAISHLRITHLNSIKLQASVMAQLTAATNQLTQKSQLLASTKCDQLALALNTIAKKVLFEDVKTVAADLAQCAANLRTVSERTDQLKLDSHLQAANGLSQQRGFILNRINDRVDEIYSRITAAAAIHLNLGQNVTVDHSSVFFSLERLTSSSISKKQLQSEDETLIRFASEIDKSLLREETLLLQVSHLAQFSSIDLLFSERRSSSR